ncbi:hypothetical protein [Kutzneria sp. NPDC051319]|uniref:hypothetical protein n=1 Tax=Kutzneria sp. NPDC051319 TaxID=3155047 RepID=UPI003418D805
MNAVWRPPDQHQTGDEAVELRLKKLLAGSPSRRVTARVVAYRLGRTAVAAGDVHLRVLFADRGLRQVIANTGEITLVGPDAHGRAVVFVDGQPTPLPAKVVAVAEQSEPESTVDVPKWFVARQAGLYWLTLAGALLAVAGFAYDAQQPILPDGQSRRLVVRPASPELMANVYVTATLWVVGPPTAGKLHAVGVPDHPIVAPARFV